MAGGLVKYRHLSRNSAHRQALLRNLVTSLIIKESIHTTYAKAKEAQRLAEKLITLAKRNTTPSKRKALGILFTPHLLLPKLFGPIRERYLDRAGGYTRVLRTEPKDPIDQGQSAILELVDGKRDMRFHITAAAVARDRLTGTPHNDLTLMNMKKAIRYRKDGDAEFEKLVRKFEDMKVSLWETDGYVPEEPEIEGGPEEEEVEGEEEEGEEHMEGKEKRPRREPLIGEMEGTGIEDMHGEGKNMMLREQKMRKGRMEEGSTDIRMKPRPKRGSGDEFDTILDTSRGKTRRKDLHRARAAGTASF